MFVECKNIIRMKNTLLIVLIVHIVDRVFASDLTKDGGNYRLRTDVPDSQSWIVSNNDKNARLYSELIGILEKMDILSSKDKLTPCLKLERIHRDVNSTSSGSTLDIHLFFTERPFQQTQRNAQISYKIANTNDVTHIVTSGCGHGSRLSAFGLDALNRKQANGSENSGSSRNMTGAVLSPQATGDSKSNGGLSRTQVVVIATCSAVIGTFFLIAGIMRLTSFVKRYRATREQALNVARRASSMGLNGSNMSSGNLRRDSSASKASRQSNPALESGSDLQVNRHDTAPPFFSSHNSSPMHNSDHNPLLPVNSQSHNSDDGSSHDSLAFIDEESRSRNKGDDIASDSEMESEDDPLLRKSPDSGSSIDVPVPMIFQNANEVMTSLKSTDPRAETTEPYPTNSEEVRQTLPSESPQNTDGLIITDDYDAEITNGENSSSTNDRRGSSNDENMEAGSDVENASDNDKSNFVDSFGNGSAGSDFETNSFVPEVNETLNNEKNLSETYAVTVGLTQSDGSISDNRNYFYGNQTEYALDNYSDCYTYSGYPYPYVPSRYNLNNIVNNDVAVSHQNDLRIQDDLSNSQGLNVDDHSNQTGSSGVSPSELSVRSLSISKDSSGEPLISNSRNSSSPPSGGGYPVSGTDNLALVDSGEDDVDTGSAQCTVVPHIVPLAEYHKISPGFSESMDQS